MAVPSEQNVTETEHVGNRSSHWCSDGERHSYGGSSSSLVSSVTRATSRRIYACTSSQGFSMFSPFAVRETSSFKGLGEMVLEFLDCLDSVKE